jgi:three-Cys-motif partner protein
MVTDFFKEKKPWSKYKDFILGYYLQPYISKLQRYGRPIAIIDCFAGPGKFQDGNDGSPLIISKLIKDWREKHKVNVVGVFIERKKEYYDELEVNLSPFKGYTSPIKGEFGNYIEKIAQLSDKNTIFVYVDPFGVKDLIFDEMEKIFKKVSKNNSVELLMNFNCNGFLRWALKALNYDSKTDEIDSDVENEEPCSIDDLNKIANGDYWQEIAISDISHEEKVENIASKYIEQLKQYFPFVNAYPIKDKLKNIPKYYLIYATRHEDGLLLMNNTMCKAKEAFLQKEFVEGKLFDMRPDSEEKSLDLLAKHVIDVVRSKPYILRKDIKIACIRGGLFCKYCDSDYNNTIKILTKEGKIMQTPGKIDDCTFYTEKT